MRKFFSFRSSSYSGGNDNLAPSDMIKSKKKLHSGETEEIGARISAQKIHGDLQTPEGHILKPLNRCLETETSSYPHLRRSLSFSSAGRSCVNQENFISLSDQSRMTSFRDDDHYMGQYPLHRDNSFTSDRDPGAGGNPRLKTVGQQNSPSSFGLHQNSSSSNSACSSPIPLRCRTTRPSQVSSQNKVLDLYIDGEHQLAQTKNSAQRNASETGEDGQVTENSKYPITRRPPRASCTTPTSPHHSAENLRSYSFREIMDKSPSTREWTSDDLKPLCLRKYSESNIARTSCAFRKSISGIRECASQTTSSVDDIHEDSSDGNPTLSSNGTAQGCSLDLIPLDKKFDEHWLCEAFNFQRKVCFSTRGSSTSGHDDLVNSQMQEHDTNEWLLKKLKELEERCYILDEGDSESEKLLCGSLSAAALIENIRRIKEDRRHLATELSSQLRCRLAERSFANERLKQFKLELNTRTWRLEKEKNELQLSLENELDRRSNEWSSKLSKFQAEEQRLRERVRELAEQNVSLQREVSSLKGGEVEARSSAVSLERQLNDMRANQDELKAENYNLCQALSELQERCNSAEEQHDQIRSSSKEKERENMELQKLVGKLNRTCSEQDKTISGLRQSYSNEVGKIFIGDNDVVQLQTEKIRLTSVEQKLRRELESCRIEMESLRNENILLLSRLQGTGNRSGFSLLRLNMELHTWMECLKMQSLSLLDDCSEFCCQLLDFITCKCSENFQAANSDTNKLSAAELALKFQSLRRAIENFKRSLLIALTTLDEKSLIQASKCTCQTTKTDSSMQQKGHRSEDDLEMELKAEAILTRLLKEKIFSRELENEQLHKDLASSVRTCDLLQTDIQRLQDEVSCLNHKKRDMEIQMLKKDENALQLQNDLQECLKDLNAARSILKNVSEERDHIWEEMKQLRESNMLMDCELKFLHKKIESLDEDILYKEGQMAILKDSVGNKSFDIICSSNSMKEFNLQ